MKLKSTINILLKSLIMIIGWQTVSLANNSKIIWKEHSTAVKHLNNLLWQDQSVNKKNGMRWDKAAGYCQNLKVMHYGKEIDGFRLPTVKELTYLYKNRVVLSNTSVRNYWSSKTKGKKYAYCVGATNNGMKIKVNKVLPQNVRCVKSNAKKYANDSMSIKALTKYFSSQRMENTTTLILPSKPIKLKHEVEKLLKKDEFETSSTFVMRVKKEKERVYTSNVKLDQDYAKIWAQWNEEVNDLKELHENKMDNLENAKKVAKAEATGKAMHVKYGRPIIKSAHYNADLQVFDVSIISEKTTQGKRSSDIDKNLLTEKVDAQKGVFTITDIRDIDKETSAITIQFHKRMRDFYLTSFGRKRARYIEGHTGDNYGLKDHESSISADPGDTLKIFIPRIIKTLYAFPNNKVLKNRFIKLLNTPEYEMKMQIPVALKYARKFKDLLLSNEFRPTVEFVELDGKLKAICIKEIKDPEQIVLEDEYHKVYNNIKGLQAFLEEHPNVALTPTVKARMHTLQKQKMEAAERREKEAVKRAEQEAQKQAKEQKAYNAQKHIGDKVCMNGKMILFLSVEISGYVEGINNDKIQIRIADTEGQSPNYNDVTLRQDTVIWDDYYRWKHCE